MDAVSIRTRMSFGYRILRAFASLDELPEQALILDLRERVEALERLADPTMRRANVSTSPTREPASASVIGGEAHHGLR